MLSLPAAAEEEQGSASALSHSFPGPAMGPTDEPQIPGWQPRPAWDQGRGGWGTQAMSLTHRLQWPGFTSSQGSRLCLDTNSFLALVDVLED